MLSTLRTNAARAVPAAAREPATVPSRPLTDAEFAAVQAHCARIIGDLLRLELTVHIEHDFHAFARFRRGVADGFCYPTFDPERCRMGASDFWLRAVDDAGNTVSTHATRIYDEVRDFYQMMRTEALWCDLLPRAVGRCRPVCSIPAFGGVIGHTGGMWVDPSQRGRGLARLLPMLSRGLQLRNHAIDFDTGLVFEPLVGLALSQYAYARCELVIDGYFPPTGQPDRVYLCHMTRDEALRSVGFAAGDDCQPRSAVA